MPLSATQACYTVASPYIWERTLSDIETRRNNRAASQAARLLIVRFRCRGLLATYEVRSPAGQ
jgi:hypothetical protein